MSLKAITIILLVLCVVGSMAFFQFRSKNENTHIYTEILKDGKKDIIVEIVKAEDNQPNVLLDKSKGIMTRVPDDASSSLTVYSSHHEQQLLDSLVDSSDDDTARNEMINVLRRTKSAKLPNALGQVLANPAEKPRFRAFAVQHLGTMLDEPGYEFTHNSIVAQLESALKDPEVQVQREALMPLARAKHPEALKQIDAIVVGGDSSTGLLDIAIHCLHALNRRDAISAIRKHVRSENEVVRISAIVVLSDWGDEESRFAFEEAAKSKTKRLQRAGEAALLKLGPLATSSAPSPQAMIEGLNSKDRSLRIKAAQQVIQLGKVGHRALPGLTHAIERLDRSSPLDEVGLYLEAVRGMGKEGAKAADAIAGLLPERASVFQERPKEDLHTIRALAIWTLGEISRAEVAQLAILDYLANSDRDLSLQFALSARAALALPNAKMTVPLLVRSLQKDFSDRSVLVPVYAPGQKPVLTSGRKEALLALKKLGKEASEALPALVEFVENNTRPDLCRAAEEAMAEIKKGQKP